jgi:rhamnosyltransferase
MPMPKYDATVMIPSFNGKEFIAETIQAILSQKTHLKYELLIIDSGSDEETLNIIRSFQEVRLHQIPNKEFGHGRTRNLAAELSDSEFVLYLTDDAIPSHDRWLDNMLEPFSISPKVGCVFGKQIPRPHCFVSIKREVAQVFKSFGDDGSISIQRKSDLTDALGITNNFMSDVNSAIRKSIWEKVKFQNVNYSEDQLMGIDMLNAGYYKAYAPLGSVNHSHDYPLRKYSKRKFDEYVGLRKSTGYTAQAGLKELFLGSIKATLQDYVFLFRDKDYGFVEKVHDFILSPAYNIALRLTIRRAARSLTDEQVNRHSLEYVARSKAQDVNKESKTE